MARAAPVSHENFLMRGFLYRPMAPMRSVRTLLMAASVRGFAFDRPFSTTYHQYLRPCAVFLPAAAFLVHSGGVAQMVRATDS